MLIHTFAHSGRPPEPHDLWQSWNFDPLLISGLALAGWLYWRGYQARPTTTRGMWRARCFLGALVTIAIALVSPLDAISSALASAHMVQHVLLVLVAAPLLAVSAPFTTLLRGSPPAVRRVGIDIHRRLVHMRRTRRAMRDPIVVSLLYAGTLSFWHAAGPYDAALGNELVHVVEHLAFFVTALLFWRVVTGTRAAGRVSSGTGVLLVFAVALHSVFLSALLTFASEPWYSGYATTTQAWGLDPLTDQQLAGVIMWIPAGFVYVATAIALTVSWLRTAEREDVILFR